MEKLEGGVGLGEGKRGKEEEVEGEVTADLAGLPTICEF